MHSYKENVALSSEFMSPESYKGNDSPKNVNLLEKSPLSNMRSNPRLGASDSPIMGKGNLYL